MRETAVQMKAKRDYVGAAGLFVKAGEKFASAANAGGHLRNHALLQAGKCFEDAVGCFGLVKMEDRAITARERAAEVFAASEHTMSRAARLYETLGDDAAKKSPSLGLNYYRKAVSCFDAANDKRSLSVNAKIAEQLAILRDYKEAILIFDNCARDSADDRVLRFSVKTYVFNALLCMAGQKDDVRFAKGVENYLNRFPMCEDYSEAKVFGDIANAWINRDVARFDAVVGRFKSISSPPLAQWQDAALSAARDALLADAGSLR
ncbi:soluble NSF attachment protein [Zopfochytrium polystomum]|nr:soluble NSF attachment protein [Zopfochytrium polystomum]